MYRPRRFYLKIAIFLRSRVEEKSRKRDTLREIMKKGAKMKTGLHKREKTTEIFFDEAGPMVEIRTHNTDLKKRLTAYAVEHPDLCRITDEDTETGCKSFVIPKGRFSFRLTAPYSEARRRAATEVAKARHPSQWSLL